MQGTPFNLVYGPNSANQVSQQIVATYRGANEYRPNQVAGVPVTQGRRVRQANTGYVQYVNYAAFTLPATKTPAVRCQPVWQCVAKSRAHAGVSTKPI